MIQNPTVFVAAPASGAKVPPGVACMIVAMLLLPIGDSFAKALNSAKNPVSVTTPKGFCRWISEQPPHDTDI